MLSICPNVHLSSSIIYVAHPPRSVSPLFFFFPPSPPVTERRRNYPVLVFPLVLPFLFGVHQSGEAWVEWKLQQLISRRNLCEISPCLHCSPAQQVSWLPLNQQVIQHENDCGSTTFFFCHPESN